MSSPSDVVECPPDWKTGPHTKDKVDLIVREPKTNLLYDTINLRFSPLYPSFCEVPIFEETLAIFFMRVILPLTYLFLVLAKNANKEYSCS